MNNSEPNQAMDLKQLIGHLGDLLKVLGSAVGATSLGAMIIYAMGFVVINTSLLRHGAYDISLLRAEFLAAGISYSVLTLGMIFLGAVMVDWLVPHVEFVLKRLKREKTSPLPLRTSHVVTSLLIIFLIGALLLLAISHITRLFPAGIQWWHRFGRAVVWGYMVALVGGIYVEYLDRQDFWQELSAPAPEFPKLGRPILLGASFLLVALVSYGGYAYPYLPKSWGGGSPIYVEFVINEEARPMLETLGLRIGSEGLTERVEYLTESSKRVFVVTQQGDTLSFDPSLVQASKFYDVDYYVSAEAHLSRGDWYREQRHWNMAIREYNAALLIQANLLDARIGRGIVYTERYRENVWSETPNEQAYNAAYNDLTEAIMQAQAEEMRDDHKAAQAYYQRGRLYFYHGSKNKGASDVSNAIRLDATFMRRAMLEEAFRQDILANQDFRDTLYTMNDGELAEEYGALGHIIAEDQPEQAIYLYDAAARLARKAQDMPNRLERSAYFYSLKGQILESLSQNDEALQTWREALETDPNNLTYYYRYALLAYNRGLLDETREKCNVVLSRGNEDPATIGCQILRGNLYRDEENLNQAIEDYDRAFKKSIELGFPTFAANAFYQWAKLESRRGNAEQAILLLEKAAWLDRTRAERAELDSDFDILRESAEYQKALSPPVIVEISSKAEDRTISFLLQTPTDDFPERVTVLITQVLRLTDLIPLDEAGRVTLSHVSEDQRLYTFQLREEASTSASELASALRKIVGLAE